MAKNYNHVYWKKGGVYRDKDGKITKNAVRLILAKRNGKDKILVIELERKAKHWTVITGGVRGKKNWQRNLIELWSKEPKVIGN